MSRLTTIATRVLATLAMLQLTPAASADPPGPPGKALTVYHIGNSHTRGLSLDRVAKLFASAGGSYNYGSSLFAGVTLWKSLAQFSGAGYDPNNLESGKFGDWQTAWQAHDFDAIIFQPYQEHLDLAPAGTAPPGNIRMGDRQAINRFIGYALGQEPVAIYGPAYASTKQTTTYTNTNPGGTTTRFYIYTSWPTIGGVYGRSAGDNDQFDEFYEAPYSPSATVQNAVPCRDYYRKLADAVNADNPQLPVPVRVVPVGDVFCELDKKIRNGTLPGIVEHFARQEGYYTKAREVKPGATKFPFNGFVQERGVLNFYADGTHMNDQPHNDGNSGTAGAYVTALTFYATLAGQSPVGLTAAPHEKLDPASDAALITALQQIVWDVVAGHPYTGVPKAPR